MGMTTDVHVRELRYFAAVAEELHFTRAAERLYVSQPALSKQIRTLERQLGAELFRRDRQGVTLTEAGTALLPHARRVLADWTEGAAAVEAARAARRGTLVVGMSTSPGRGGLLPAIRSRFTAAHPEAVLRLRQVTWEDPTASLSDGTADVAYVWLPLPDADRYAWTVVAEEPRLVALPDTHPLAAREEIDFADLTDEPFLALPPEAGVLRDFWLALDERRALDGPDARPSARRRRDIRHGGDVRGPGRGSRHLLRGHRKRPADHSGRRRHPPGPRPGSQPLRPGPAPRGRGADAGARVRGGVPSSGSPDLTGPRGGCAGRPSPSPGRVCSSSTT